MKIIKETSDQLVLRERLLGIWFLGGCTATIGFFFILAFDTPVDLLGGCCIALAVIIGTLSPTATCTFDRVTHRLILEQQHLFSRRVTQYALPATPEVMVEPYRVMGAVFYRVVVVLPAGQRLALTRSANTEQALQQALADRVNGFLQSYSPQMTVGVAGQCEA